jgi:peptidoglycan/LPS O-acetylase OafA/YrhL
MDSRNGYMPQLDGLRALAVVFVLIHHFYPELPNLLGLDFGAYGVKLFFVLSGFLITGILLAMRSKLDRGKMTAAHAFRQFYARRTLRIFPVYYLVLLLALLAGNADVAEGFWWYVTYTSNIYFGIENDFTETTAHLWMLSVEEQF